MVKKLISGILGKKEEKQESNEDVPDELPPLAEDIVAKISEEPKAEAKVESTPAKEALKDEVPDELPPLAEPIIEKKEFDSGTLEDLEKETLPDAIRKAKMAKITVPEERPKIAITPDIIKSSKEEFTIKERISAGAETGFFSNIIEHVKKQGSKEKLLSGDLFARMGSYWDMKKHEIKTGSAIPVEKKLESDLIGKLEELKSLEQKWQIQRLALEEDLKFIHERERDIQSKIKELRMVSNELNLFRNVKPEEYFHLHNGVVLKNLHDLIDVLEIIDEETFTYHTKNGKNDFAQWVLNIFKDKNLADKINSAAGKMEIIEALETIPIKSDEDEKIMTNVISNPKKYFWLANGVVIRSLYELIDDLKVMDDGLFGTHVNPRKNDFAKWINDSLKNEHLAERLNSSKSKKEMLEILEAYI